MTCMLTMHAWAGMSKGSSSAVVLSSTAGHGEKLQAPAAALGPRQPPEGSFTEPGQSPEAALISRQVPAQTIVIKLNTS